MHLINHDHADDDDSGDHDDGGDDQDDGDGGGHADDDESGDLVYDIDHNEWNLEVVICEIIQKQLSNVSILCAVVGQC